MYQHTAFDQRLVDKCFAQFRDQTERHLAGELSGDDCKVLRLQNGLYIQEHHDRPIRVRCTGRSGEHAFR